MNDPYVARAHAEGYRARSAFKLIELDDRYKLLAPGKRVVDLGAAPGGWSQIAADRVKATAERPLVVAIDYLDMDPLPGVVVLKQDFLDAAAPDAIRDALGAKADVVISDLAAPTTGHRKTDHLRTIALVEAAAEFAGTILKPGGDFVRQGFPRRHRGRAAGEAEARFCRRPSRQAAGQPRRVSRALPGRERLSRLALAHHRYGIGDCLAAGHLVAGVLGQPRERDERGQRDQPDDRERHPEVAGDDLVA